MATKAKTTTTTKTKTSTINRSKNNSSTRKCLPKSFKILFSGAKSSEFKMILAAWKESRKKSKES